MEENLYGEESLNFVRIVPNTVNFTADKAPFILDELE